MAYDVYEWFDPEVGRKPRPTFEEMRDATLKAYDRVGYDPIRNLFLVHGAARLCDIGENHYSAVLIGLEAL